LLNPRKPIPDPSITLLGVPWWRKDQAIEIILSPGLRVVPELLLIAAVASHWIVRYFGSGGGG
jgi:hypothetical protein